jgi:hypothetical protein
MRSLREEVLPALLAQGEKQGEAVRAQGEALVALREEVRAMKPLTRIWSAGPSHHDSESSSENQISFKEKLITHWECGQKEQERSASASDIWGASRRSTPSPTSGRRPHGSLSSLQHEQARASVKCMLTQQHFPRSEVRAAHLFPKRSADIFHTTLGLSADLINHVRNGLLLCRSIEDAYDRQRVCFIYNPLDAKFYFRVLDSQLRDRPAEPSQKTFGQLDRQALWLPDGKFPFRRVLALHAREALVHARTEYAYIPDPEDEEAIETALDLSDRLSRDADQREGDEKGADDSAVLGNIPGDDDDVDDSFHFA